MMAYDFFLIKKLFSFLIFFFLVIPLTKRPGSGWSQVDHRGSGRPRCRTQHQAPVLTRHLKGCMLSHFSRVRFCVTPRTVTLQDPLSMGFSRQECWSGLPCPPPGGLPHPGIEPTPLKSPELAGRVLTASTTWGVRTKSPGEPLKYTCTQAPAQTGDPGMRHRHRI